jgi:hypothetical protein
VFVPAHQFYAATYGTPNGDGSLANPWDLQTALNQPASVQPGDEIWLRGGTYNGNFTSQLSGTASSPIVVRNYPGELATLDSGLSDPTSTTLWVKGQNTWFWGLNVTDSYPLLRSLAYVWNSGQGPVRGGTVNLKSPGSKLINMTIHDGCDGVGFWSTDLTPNNSEVYGCIIYNNGLQDSLNGVGHSIYAQNQTGTATLKNNILLNSFGYGMQIYGSASAYANNFSLLGNDIIDPGALNTGGNGVQAILLGTSGNIAQNPVLSGNTIYINHDPTSSSQATIEFGYWGAGIENATFTGNYIYSNNGGITLNNNSGQGLTFQDSTGNTLAGVGAAGQQININYDLSAGNTVVIGKPTTNSVFVRPNDYEPGRANISVFNWQDLPSVSVDLSSSGLAVGQAFQVIDAQNPFGGPILTGTYTGAPISLPMTLTAVAQPVGNAPKPAQHTGVEYGSFVILPGTTNQTGTSTSLNSSLNPGAYGQAVTFQATVAPACAGACVPTGSVTFSAGATLLGTAPVDGSGTATFTTTSPLPTGTDAIAASYSGDTNYLASSGSLAGGEVVNQASTVTSVSVVSPSGTPVYGQSATFQATISPGSPGAGVPTGTVTFSSCGIVLGTAPVDGSGNATFTTTSPLPVGCDPVTAAYSGDANFLSSSGSLAGGETVCQASTVTSVSVVSPTGPLYGQSVTFQATISPVPAGAGVPTGTVTFSSGGTVLGTAPVNGSGNATLTTASLPAGTDPITATYSGDANFLSSSGSLAGGEVVNQVRTVSTLQLSASGSVPHGTAVTLTATITDPTTGLVPTGQVQFWDGTTLLATVTLDGYGKASWTTKSLRKGSHNLKVVYLGTNNFGGSTSGTSTLNIV